MGRVQSSAEHKIEQNVLKFAEHLGRLAGTVQARADGWMEYEKLNARLQRVRDNATDLLAQLSKLKGARGSKSARRSKMTAAQVARSVAREKAGVNGTGKKHRPAPPSARGLKHSDERIAKTIRAKQMPRTMR